MVIDGHVFWVQWNLMMDNDGLNNTDYVGLISQSSEDVASERTENLRFRLPHCRLTPLSWELSRMSAYKPDVARNYNHDLHLRPDCLGLSSFKFLWWVQKTFILKQSA